jgi:hypothetical protein
MAEYTTDRISGIAEDLPREASSYSIENTLKRLLRLHEITLVEALVALPLRLCQRGLKNIRQSGARTFYDKNEANDYSILEARTLNFIYDVLESDVKNKKKRKGKKTPSMLSYLYGKICGASFDRVFVNEVLARVYTSQPQEAPSGKARPGGFPITPNGKRVFGILAEPQAVMGNSGDRLTGRSSAPHF